MHATLPPQHVFQDKKLQTKLTDLYRKKHLPEQMVTLVSTVVKLQRASGVESAFAAGKESLPARVRQKISPPEQRHAGRAILQSQDFPLDMRAVTELARELLIALPESAPELGAYTRELEARLADDPALLEAACREILDPSLAKDAAPHLGAWAREHPEAPYFFRFITTSAATPSFAAVGRILGEEHNTDNVWAHGHCPVCGSLPLIGRLEGKEGRRLHTCSLCSFEYRVPRLGCPFCLAPETEGSEYHISEEEPGYLLTACKACNTYFKLGDAREFDRPWFPLLDDLASLTLDLYAIQMGYKRPTLSGWGF